MPDARPTEPLSIFSLAAGIAALVLTLFSVMPLALMCTLPLGGLSALAAFVTGVISVVQTFRKPHLEGRAQALMGIALSLAWALSSAALVWWMSRRT